MRNHYNKNWTNILAFRNREQVVLWDEELSGQISDGAWENTYGTGWEIWCSADLIVDPDNVGHTFDGYGRYKRAFAFKKALITQMIQHCGNHGEGLGRRMRAYVVADKLFGEQAVYNDVKYICEYICEGQTFDELYRSYVKRADNDKCSYSKEKATAMVRHENELRQFPDALEMYSFKQLLKDLTDINRIIKIDRKVTQNDG